jgi:hypothetical protein
MGKQYRVEPEGEGWRIKVDGAQHGPYTSKVEAIAAAIDAARNLGPELDARSQVLVQQTDRSYRVLWTYGRDAMRSAAVARSR